MKSCQRCYGPCESKLTVLDRLPGLTWLSSLSKTPHLEVLLDFGRRYSTCPIPSHTLAVVLPHLFRSPAILPQPRKVDRIVVAVYRTDEDNT